MKKSFSISIILFLAASVMVPMNLLAQDLYIKEIKEERYKKNLEFFEEETSPLKKKKDRKKFEGLSYYDVDVKYRVIAELQKTPEAKSFEIETSSGKTKPYRQYGILHFNLGGRHMHAPVYQNLRLIEEEGYADALFFPFTDLSNGETTYEAGRYIDMRIPPGGSGQIIIDFNKAYNPYCAYSDGWSCPIPPPGNHIEVFISAGEKVYLK